MSVIQSNKELIPSDDLNWGNNVKAYHQNKKQLNWSNNVMPRFITNKMMKEKDHKYNPVIQQYYDEAINKSIESSEKANLKHSLSQYYDNSLRYQQTFDLINLTDRLKGFENHANYPHASKPKQKINKETTRASYNILSNISLNQHSPLPPEMRNFNEVSAPITKQHIISAFLYKDYDIISNRYINNHDQKTLIDHQINELNASKQLKERNGYDFINGRAYNKEIQDKYNNKTNQHKKIITKSPLYNPVNNSVLDEQRLTLLDQKKQNKILRYQVKQSTEQYYKDKAINEDLKKECRMKNHQSYSRYRAFDQRGYEAINHQRNFGYYRKNFNLKNDKSDWEIIQKNTSDKGTFNTKQIYKPLYDTSNLDDNLDKFYFNRKVFLGSLPKLEDETSFKRFHHIPKINHDKLNEDIKAKLQNSIHGDKVDINKKEWFTTKKTVGVGL